MEEPSDTLALDNQSSQYGHSGWASAGFTCLPPQTIRFGSSWLW